MSAARALVARALETPIDDEPNEFHLTNLDLDFYVRPIVALYKRSMGIEKGEEPWIPFGASRRPQRQLEVEVAAPRRIDFGGVWDRQEGQFSWIGSGSKRTIYFEPVLRIDRVSERFPWAGIRTRADVLAVLTLHELGHFHDRVRGLGFDGLDMTDTAKAAWYRRVERDADRHARRWWKARRFPVRGRRSAQATKAIEGEIKKWGPEISKGVPVFANYLRGRARVKETRPRLLLAAGGAR